MSVLARPRDGCFEDLMGSVSGKRRRLDLSILCQAGGGKDGRKKRETEKPEKWTSDKLAEWKRETDAGERWHTRRGGEGLEWWWTERRRLRALGLVRCLECHSTGKRSFMLSKHVRRVHPGERNNPFKCPDCRAAFSTLDDNELHVRFSHPRAPKYCLHADCTLETRAHLGQRHNSPHACPECGYLYETDEAVADHVHTVHGLHRAEWIRAVDSLEPIGSAFVARRKVAVVEPVSPDEMAGPSRAHMPQFVRRMADARLMMLTHQVMRLGVLVRHAIKRRDAGDMEAAKAGPLIDLMSKLFVFPKGSPKVA